MSLYPQIGSGTLGSPQGLADRIRDMERTIASLGAVQTYIGQGSILSGHIGALQITATHIDAGSITTAMIQTGAINAGHMQADSITVTNAALSNLVVTSAKIADGAILTVKIGDAQITSAKIGLLQVQTANIDNLAVTTAKIGLLAVDSAQIKDASIITAKIGDAQITDAKVANLDGAKINAGTLNADRLVATSASADTLLSRLITAGSVVATTGLSAVSAKVGNLVIDTTFGGSILVGTSGGARIVTDNTGITGYSDATNVTFKLDRSTGKVITLAGLGGDNLLLNSSGERADSILPWNLVSAGTLTTVASATAYHGARVLSLSPSGANSAAYAQQLVNNIKVGRNYCLSAFVRGPGVRGIALYINWTASDGSTLIRQDTVAGTTSASSTTWTRIELSKQSGGTPIDAPAGAVYAYVYVMCVNGAGGTETFQIDAVQFEEGTIVTGYAPRADEVLPNTITGLELAPNSVSGNVAGASEVHIIPGSIVATDLSVTSLSAITANMGTMTAGRISGGTIDGNVLDAGSILAGKLSVGAWARSAVMNGGFEDAKDGDATMAAHWSRNLAFGGTQPVTRTTGAARSGSYGMSLAPGSGANCDLRSDGVPVSEGELWHLTFWARKTGTGTTSAYVGVCWGTTSNPLALLAWDVLSATDLSTTWTKYSAQMTVPAGYTWGAPLFLNYIYNTGGVIEVDDVDFSKALIGTQITDGAISTQKLTATAIDGMTITGAVLRTSASNPRIELTGGASGSLKKYASDGSTPVVLGSTDGLDLLAGTSSTPPSDRRLRWVSGVSSVSEIYAYEASSQIQTWFKTEGTVGSPAASTALWARRGGTSQDSQVLVDSLASGVSSVRVHTGSLELTLLRQDNYSDFMRELYQPGMASMRGEVTSAGAVAFGQGWSVVRNSVGDYTVTFANSFASTPTMVVTPISSSGAGSVMLWVYARSTTGFSYVVRNAASTLIDVAAMFLCQGPLL